MPTGSWSASPDRLFSGRLILVVGPSGCGKDTLLDAARTAFADNPHIHFARRDITRPRSSGGEQHREVSVVDFERNLAEGKYALHWDAHRLRYGISTEELIPLERGEIVVLNGSRSVIAVTCKTFPDVRVISIRVSHDVLEARLQNRGREGQEAVAKRLSRAEAFDVAGPHVIEIWNEGTVEEGISKFLNAMRESID